MWWLIPPSLITAWILIPECPLFHDNPYLNWVDFGYTAGLCVGGWMLILYGHYTA